jgi:hypothetical protein
MDLMNPDGPVLLILFLRDSTYIDVEYKLVRFVIKGCSNFGYLTIGGVLVFDTINIGYVVCGEKTGIYTNRNLVWFHRISFFYKTV